MQLQEDLLQHEVVTQVPDPAAIMHVGTGFMASKTLLAAIKLGVFTLLGEKKLTAQEISGALALHSRSIYDFLDALVALGFLEREGLYDEALYSNTFNTGLFLDKNKITYMGGILEMCNDRLYKFWGNLEEGLKTGKAQNEVKESKTNPFDAFYADADRLQQFMEAMAGIQMS